MSKKTEPKTTNINWSDFGADAQTVLARLDAVTAWLNANRAGGLPKYRRADALRSVVLYGLDTAEQLMAQADVEGE
jgi:hypothetical protein